MNMANSMIKLSYQIPFYKTYLMNRMIYPFDILFTYINAHFYKTNPGVEKTNERSLRGVN